MKKIVLFVTSCIVVAASSAWADPVTITFERPPCPNLGSDVYSGNCYFDLGLSLSSGGSSGLIEAFVIAADADAVSPPNVARPVPGFALNAEFFRFELGVKASGVAFDIVGSRPAPPAWEVVFATPSFIDHIRGFGDQRVSAPRDLVGGLTFFPGTPRNAIDNLTFSRSTAATPEPSTVLLIGTGAAALARRRRRPRDIASPS
jgi:hypothetical protein